LGLIFLIEFFPDRVFFSRQDLPMFELGDLDRAPSLGGSDQRTEHQRQDGSLAERIHVKANSHPYRFVQPLRAVESIA
jgi:hypothetical protein